MNITAAVVSERDRALLGGDYGNYHAQATRKIHAVRKRLGNATPRGRKYSPKSAVTAENISQNTEWVYLLLASSERAWADAMSMKSSQSPENTQKPMPGSTKKQIVSRHKRAIGYATNLVEILSDTTSKSKPTDILEAKAYLALLRGGLDFEKSRWNACIQNYAVARLIYVALGTSTKNDIYRDLVANTIDPSIKYAAYQSKLPRSKAVGDIAIEKFPASEASTRANIEQLDSHAFATTTDRAASAQTDAPSSLPTTIKWRSRQVKIEDASVSQALGFAQDKETNLIDVFDQFDKSQVGLKELSAAYEDVIDARQETVDTTKSAIDELRSQGVEQSDTRVQSLQVTRTAVNYAVIEWRIGRNRILCGRDDGLTFESQPGKPISKLRKDGKARPPKEESSGRKLSRLRERVALYDSVLQSLNSIKDLPGVVADTQLVQEVDGKKAYFRALKCLAIGRSYALEGKISDALALFGRADDLVKHMDPVVVVQAISTSSPTKLDITSTQHEAAKKHLYSLTTQYRALAELKGFSSKPKSEGQVSLPPLAERFHLNQYFEDADPHNLVNYPSKLQAIPVKPLFFDMAWNYIQYPGQKTNVSEPVAATTTETKEEKPARKGWFGFGR